jgi:rubrerythrin
MEKFSIHEVLEQAIRTEKLGNEFYNEMAERFENESTLRDLFIFLAQQEVQHEKFFSALKARTKEEEFENWEEVSNYFRAVVESEFFLGKNKSLPSMEHILSAYQAVTFAIDFERETVLYFLGLKEAVKEKEAVDEIINEEKRHIAILSRYRDSFVV